MSASRKRKFSRLSARIPPVSDWHRDTGVRLIMFFTDSAHTNSVRSDSAAKGQNTGESTELWRTCIHADPQQCLIGYCGQGVHSVCEQDWANQQAFDSWGNKIMQMQQKKSMNWTIHILVSLSLLFITLGKEKDHACAWDIEFHSIFFWGGGEG